MVADDPESFADLDGHETHCYGEKLKLPECHSDNPYQGGENPNPATAAENGGHRGIFGLVRDFLDIAEVSGSYGWSVGSHGEAGSSEYHVGVGVDTEGSIGLGGGNGKVETFAGGKAGGKIVKLEGEIKAGGTVSSKEGSSLNAEAKGSIGGAGGKVTVDKSGVTITPQVETQKDLKLGIHGQLGLGVSVNVTQATRAWERGAQSANALLNAISDKLHSYSLPNFKRGQESGPSFH